MKLAHLRSVHDSYDADTWARYEALYRGGKHFRSMVGKFLPPNPMEPSDVYHQRIGEASYRSYVGPIVDYFASQLMAAPLAIRALTPDGDDVAALDPFYARFKEDVDGAGADLVDFARDVFRGALVKGASWILAALPDNSGRTPRSRSEWEARGLGAAVACRLEPESVLDWEYGDDGELLWALVHEVSRPRASLAASRSLIHERWRLYDRESVEVFERIWDPSRDRDDPDVDVPSVSLTRHGFDRVPLVRVEPPAGLWLMNRVAAPQQEHFKLSAGLGWAIRRTCYAMPVFKLAGGSSGTAPMGTGYYLMIGQDDDMVWAAPPSQPFDVISAEIKAQKDEIYRVAQQMAQGVENNAAAVGRSAQSKSADSASTEVCLVAYGAIVREAIEKLYDMIASGRGEALRFSVSGLDRFNLLDSTVAVENATKAKALGIPSLTFAKELMMHTAEALMPGLTQEKKDAIWKEIDAGAELMRPDPEPVKSDSEDESEDESEPEDDDESEPKELDQSGS